jgi:hypothetical protein
MKPSFWFAFLFLTITNHSFSQQPVVRVVSWDSLNGGIVALNAGWKFMEGDDPVWSGPSHDDRSWQKRYSFNE